MKKNYINEICTTLKALHKQYPNQGMGRHFDAAFADYPSLFGISDQEFLYALHKYQATLEIDPIASEAEVDKIIREGMDLKSLFENDEEDDY